MRTSALVRLTAFLTSTLVTGALLAQPAAADETPLPVVGADSVTLYPGQSTELNLLDNDTSPSGDDLALCRFPGLDIFFEDIPEVMVMEAAMYGGEPGDVMVQVMPGVKGTHEIDYYVCDHTHLVPATLTVNVRPVEPVEVTKLRHKAGRLHVTNHNEKTVRFLYGDPRGAKFDGRVRVAPGDTVTVRVQRHRIAWYALIGHVSKGMSLTGPGIADFGVVRHIELNGKPLPAPHHGGWQVDSTSATSVFVGRWH